MKRPLAYITAPWSKNPHENAANAASYCRQVYDAGYSPVCPVLFLPLFLKDEIPQEHKDGIDIARDLLPSIFPSGFRVQWKPCSWKPGIRQITEQPTKAWK